MLRLRGIRTFDDLNDGQGDVLRPLVEEGATPRTKTDDSNRSRWPLHPLWVDLAERVAAIHGLQRGKEEVSKDEALHRLGWLMDRFHDPLSWDGEVKRRMTEMRSGQ